MVLLNKKKILIDELNQVPYLILVYIVYLNIYKYTFLISFKISKLLLIINILIKYKI